MQTSGIRIVFTGQHSPGSNSLYIARALEQCGATIRFLDDTSVFPNWRDKWSRGLRRLLLKTVIEPEWNRQLLAMVSQMRPHLVYITNADYCHRETLQSIRDGGIDIVYHAAALKQVPNCELYPMEAVLTNIIGAENIRRAALAHEVGMVISVSADKAVKAVNAMGMTKALAEKVLLAGGAGDSGSTRFVMVRYGNVVGSRGSVVPLFGQRIAQNRPLPITNPAMTRFLLTLPEAIDLVFHATVHGCSGHLYVRRMPACTVLELAQAMAKCCTGSPDYPMTIGGVRPGEKLHETLVSEEEMVRAEESRWHYDIHPAGAFVAPERRSSGFSEYRSDNTGGLSEDELARLLEAGGWARLAKAHSATP